MKRAIRYGRTDGPTTIMENGNASLTKLGFWENKKRVIYKKKISSFIGFPTIKPKKTLLQ